MQLRVAMFSSSFKVWTCEKPELHRQHSETTGIKGSM